MELIDTIELKYILAFNNSMQLILLFIFIEFFYIKEVEKKKKAI